MDSPLRPNEVVINALNNHVFARDDFHVPGEFKRRGLKPRNYSTHPVGYLGALARPFDLPLIPQGEWQERLDEQIANKAQLSNIRDVSGPSGGPIPSRDQDSIGYCWCHSGVSAHLLARAVANEPYVDLSPFAIGCMIKGYRDEGGWGAEGVEFEGERGCPTAEFWPQQSRSRSNDNPNTWANAKLHRYTEWMDGEPGSKSQLVTALLLNMPVVVDFNWWSHSVCATDLVSLNPFRIRIWNSWGDSWSANGMGVLEGSHAIPDGQVVCRVTTPSSI